MNLLEAMENLLKADVLDAVFTGNRTEEWFNATEKDTEIDFKDEEEGKNIIIKGISRKNITEQLLIEKKLKLSKKCDHVYDITEDGKCFLSKINKTELSELINPPIV